MLYLAAYGWTETAWADGFYPEDLPAEWRLDYYANEFSAVVVPAAYLAPEAARQWRADVPEGFRLFLELSGTERTLPELLESLGDSVAGLLLSAEADMAAMRVQAVAELPMCLALSRAPTRFELEQAERYGIDVCWPDDEGESCRGERLAIRRIEAAAAPRELRQAIEQLTAAARDAVLVCDGPGAVETLRNGRVIAELLGLTA